MAGGQILAFFIDIDRRPYNTLALPCVCVMFSVCVCVCVCVCACVCMWISFFLPEMVNKVEYITEW